MSQEEFFGETSNHPGDSAPLQPRFDTMWLLWLLAFPKTKITFEREEISDRGWDSGKYDGAADGDFNKGFCSVLNSGRDTGRTVWGPKEPALKGTEPSLSHVQCFLYLVSSSVNVCIFHSTWLDTFWTDHTHTHTRLENKEEQALPAPYAVDGVMTGRSRKELGALVPIPQQI